MEEELGIQSLIPALGILLACLYICFVLGFFSFDSFKKAKFPKLAGLSVFLVFFTYIAMQGLIVPLLYTLGYFFLTGANLDTALLSGKQQAWLSFCGVLLSVGTVFLSAKLIFTRSDYKKIWRTNESRAFKSFLNGAGTTVLLVPLISCITHSFAVFMQYMDISEEEQVAVTVFKMTEGDPYLQVLAFLTITLAVPFVEEFLFRGCFQNYLRRYFKPLYSILLTSILFAAFHFSPAQGFSNIPLIISLILASYFFGILYSRYRTLWAPIGLHVSFNFFNLVLLILKS
jgi:membrane protease YdiL (CAAX protease family)